MPADDEIRSALTNHRNNVPKNVIHDFTWAIEELTPAEIVELMRVCAVGLAFRMAGEGAGSVSSEVKAHLVKEVFQLALDSVEF